METARIAELLAPFTGGETLAPPLLERCAVPGGVAALECARESDRGARSRGDRDSALRRVAVRGAGLAARGAELRRLRRWRTSGREPGFPGIPMKLFAPEIELTLIESHTRKLHFCARWCGAGPRGGQVFAGRAEQWARTADLVTLRAVEQFERALPMAAKLVAKDGRLGLLVGAGQIPTAQDDPGKELEVG